MENNMGTRALVFILFATMFGIGVAASASDKALDRSFAVQPGGRLSVQLDSGSIVVRGTDANQVAVHLRARGTERELAKLEWSAEKDAQGVVVKAKDRNEKGLFDWSNDMEITATIEVPREYNLELSTAGGALEVRDLHGKANGRTSGGRITVENVRGEVQMRTSGGPIVATKIEGATQLQTSGGTIEATRIAGGLKAHTSGGSIRIAQAKGALDVHTSGGSIDIDLEGDNAGVSARTSGGSITLRAPKSLRASLNASTSGGRVKSDFPVATNESSESSLHGTINGGGPEIVARSSGGSIRLVRRD
jgi:DUF4097 and DUF4098 domain-containing protein YvlB